MGDRTVALDARGQSKRAEQAGLSGTTRRASPGILFPLQALSGRSQQDTRLARQPGEMEQGRACIEQLRYGKKTVGGALKLRRQAPGGRAGGSRGGGAEGWPALPGRAAQGAPAAARARPHSCAGPDQPRGAGARCSALAAHAGARAGQPAAGACVCWAGTLCCCTPSCTHAAPRSWCAVKACRSCPAPRPTQCQPPGLRPGSEVGPHQLFLAWLGENLLSGTGSDPVWPCVGLR